MCIVIIYFPDFDVINDQKSPDKKINILRTKRALKVK